MDNETMMKLEAAIDEESGPITTEMRELLRRQMDEIQAMATKAREDGSPDGEGALMAMLAGGDALMYCARMMMSEEVRQSLGIGALTFEERIEVIRSQWPVEHLRAVEASEKKLVSNMEPCSVATVKLAGRVTKEIAEFIKVLQETVTEDAQIALGMIATLCSVNLQKSLQAMDPKYAQSWASMHNGRVVLESEARQVNPSEVH